MKTYLLLGGNVGDRYQNLAFARDAIGKTIAPVIIESAIYETAPWGNGNQPAFLNQVILIDAGLEPEILLKKVKSIEKMAGRRRIEKWGPRIIDIDILLMGDLIYQSVSLRVPHPQMHNRRFTLVPLAEIAPGIIHPQFNLTIRDLLARCRDELDVHLYPPVPASPVSK